MLETAGQVPGPLPGGGQGAGGVIDTQVAASRLRRDHPAGTGHPAAQVEHADAGADPGLVSQRPDLAGPHEALLAHILARGEGGRLGLLERRQVGCSLIVSHISSRTVPGRASVCPAAELNLTCRRAVIPRGAHLDPCPQGLGGENCLTLPPEERTR